MRLWCLTSLTINPFKQSKELERYKFQGLESLPFDKYKTVKQQIINKHLLNASNYELSEIRIGKRDERFYFVLCRQDIKVFNILMTKGALTALPRRNEESVIIDILIDNDKLETEVLPEKFISKIRIRAIKNTSVKRKISDKEVQQYNNYAKLINQLSSGNSENHEAAFKQVGPLILPNPSETKRLEQKITDLYNVINDLWHPETGDISNVSQTARYYNGLYDFEVLRFEPGRYDSRFEKTKDFTGCYFLLYDSIKLSRINERWFLAEGLITLVIKNCNIFTKSGMLDIFGKSIGKFKQLSTLELSKCKIDKISEILLKNLSKSIIELILFENNISVIPSSIGRLVNLEVLNLNDNPELDDAGIPWKNLPKTLMFLELKNTKVTKIPNAAKKLSSLRTLNVEGPNLKEIDWDGLTEDLEKLSLSNLLVFNNAKAVDSHINAFILSNENLTQDRAIIIPSHVRELNLSNNKIDFTTFNFHQPPFSLLKILILSKNRLSSIPWDVLPSTLEILDLSQNIFKEIESVKNLTELKEFLMSDNRIFKITAEFNELKKLKIIDLSKNSLSSLPKGFEFIFSNYLTLNLATNKFNYKNGRIEKDLWNRLPSTWHLNLNQNILGELPCQLIAKIMEIQAIDCKLKYICPQIYAKLYDFNDPRYNRFRQRILINISKNDDLKTLSFIPKKNFSTIPLSTEKPTDEHRYFLRVLGETQLTALNNYPEWSVIVSDKELLRNTSRFPKIGKKPVYNFKEVEETKDEKEGICKCCAYCNHNFNQNNAQKTIMIEQQMIMDCVFSVVNEENLLHNFSAYDQPGWQAGKWKALIRTRLCQRCINKLKNNIYSPSLITDEIFIEQEAKRHRIENDSEVENEQQLNVNNSPEIEEMEFNVDNIFVQSPEMENFRSPIEGPTFGFIEITWIKYILENSTHPINISEEYPNWRYFFPSEEYLIGICAWENHGIDFDSYPFSGYENFNNSIIFGKTNLLTVKTNPDQFSGYRSLSYLITGNEHSFNQIKNLIHNHIEQQYLPQSFYMIYHAMINTFDESIRECDLYAAANLFQLNIFVFNFQNNGKWFLINETCLEASLTQFLPQRPSILMSKTCDNLYNPVLAAAD